MDSEEQQNQRPGSSDDLGDNVLALLAYGALSLLMTWPAAARLGTHLAGGREDLWIHQWTFWWLREALAQGQNPFHTTYLYFPDGVSLTSHNIAWFNFALWFPLQRFVGETAAYSLLVPLFFALNGFATYLFAQKVVNHKLAAFAAGVIVAFWPYTMSHYDHANMYVIFWVPLALLGLHYLLTGRSWLAAAGTAVAVSMIGITRWQLLLMSAPILVAYALFLGLQTGALRVRRVWLQLLAAGLGAGLLMAPLAAPVISTQISRDFPEDAFLNEPELGRTDLLAYVTPGLYHPLWGDAVSPLYENYAANKLYTPFLGYTLLLLAGWAALRHTRQNWFWLLLAALYFLLALGVDLAVNGRVFAGVPMPYRLVEDWFLFRVIRRPHRLNIFLSLPLAMLAGHTLAQIAAKNGRAQRFLVVGLTGLILFEYLPLPFATTPAKVPAFYQTQFPSDASFAVLDLPINNRGYDKQYMFYQTIHGQPMLTGHVSRLPREAFSYMNSVPFLQTALAQDSVPDTNLPDVSHQLALLADANVRYLILHKQFANAGLITAWQDWLTIAPRYEDEDVIVYETRPEQGRSFTLTHRLSDELGLIRVTATPADPVAGGTIKVDARWGSLAAPDGMLDACFTLDDGQGNAAYARCEPLNAAWPTARWQSDEVVRSFYVLPLPRALPAGEYTLTLTLVDSSGANIGETVVVASHSVHPLAPAAASDLAWDATLQLIGYDLEKTAATLRLTGYWQTAQPLSRSLKLFVHLRNPDTGEVVAQSDAVPRGWTYPTSVWEPKEVVRDEVVLSLEAVPAGTYEVWLGWYDPESGVRLPVTDGTEADLADAARLAVVEHNP